MTATLARGLRPVRAELANGAVVIVQQTSMTPAVTISASFRAGSMFDPRELPGLSYLTGRVLDRGTERRTASHIAEDLDDRGISLKVSTNRHALTLSCTCLSEDFDDVFEILADVMRRPIFPDAEVEKRRAEAITTLRQNEDTPGLRAVDAVLELLYSPAHPYGRPPKGTAAGVAGVRQSDMRAFHARRIRPGVLSLAIVGDVEASHAIPRVAMELEDWEAEPADLFSLPPPQRITRQRKAVIEMPAKPQSEIVYGVTTVRRLDPRFPAYWMMNIIFGQFGLGGRLADNIRERQGMAYYAFSTFDPAAAEAPLLIRAGVDPSDVDRTLEAIEQEMSSLAADGPTAKEIEESRAYLIGSIPRLLETNQSIAAFLQTNEEYGLGLDFDQQLPGLLRRVTREEIASAASEALRPDRAAVAVAGPSGASVRTALTSSAPAATTGAGQIGPA